jgi:hypothetical protein
MYVVVIQVTEVVLFRKLGGNEVRLRHFSLRQVKSSVISELRYYTSAIMNYLIFSRKIKNTSQTEASKKEETTLV